MEPFNFEKVYEELARPLDNREVPTNPFGPMLLKVLLEDDGIFIIGTLPPSAMLPFFMSNEGAEHLRQLIDQMLSKQGESFCIVQTHECHMKTVTAAGEELEAMKDKRLNHDPDAQHGIVLIIHHKSGKRIGCLPIDEKRFSHYAPLLPAEAELLNVNVGAKPLH